MLASPTLDDWVSRYEDLDPAERPGYALKQIAAWYHHMSKPTGNHVPDTFFWDLSLLKSILAAHLKDGELAFKASVDSATLLAYQHTLTVFTTNWEAAAKEAVDCRFKRLRQAMRAGHINLSYEHLFQEAAWTLECLTPHNLREVDAYAWQKNVPIFLGPEESKKSLRQLQQHYQEYQYKVYTTREDTTLWLLVWRTLKLAYVVSQPLSYKFPGNSESTGFVVEKDFFSNLGIRDRFGHALPEMSGRAVELVELLVEEYCKNIYQAYKREDKSCGYYDAVSDSPFISADVDEFDRRLSEKRVSARLLYLAHRAALRLSSIKGQDDLRWNRMAVDGTSWPILCASQNRLDDKLLDRKAIDLKHSVKAKLFAKPAGHSRISAFDYVHYPFPETRAHEVAASEQITRELGSPGILSDGARVQHVVNRPPRHVLPPSNVSSWATWRLRGPIGFLCYVLSSRWRSRKVKPRPEAKPRAALTHRPDLKKRLISPLSPMKDASTRIERASALATVPKLRGGGGKASSRRPRTPGSPSRPIYSPITDDGNDGNGEQGMPANGESTDVAVTTRSASPDHGIEQPLTTAEKDRRLRRFRVMTGTDSKPAYHNERFINDFLEPNGWNVELAIETYIEGVMNRQVSRNTENALGPNAASPTPRQRSPPPAAYYDPDPDPSLAPPRRPSTKSRSPAVRNTAPRPGTFDDIHDDSSSSDSLDDSDDSDPVFTYGEHGMSRVRSNRAVEYDAAGDGDSIEEEDEDQGEDQSERVHGNDDSSWNISSRFVDPSLMQGGNSDNGNTNAGGGKLEGEHEPINVPEDDETSDMYGDGAEDEENVEDDADEDDEVQNAGSDSGLDQENVPVPSMRDRFGPHPLFDIFEDDAPADVRRGNAPSARGNDSLFANNSGAQHPDADRPLQSIEDGAEPELPPQHGRYSPPRGLEGRPRSGIASGQYGTGLAFIDPLDDDDEDDEDYQPPADDGSPPHQSPQAYADMLRNGYGDGDATQSENDENHPPAPVVPRQPLAVLEERDPSLPRSGRLSPHAPGREMPCHPCPVYAGEYHHNCRCQYELLPPPPYVHSRSPAAGSAQQPQQPPAADQPGDGASPRYSPPDDRRDMSHPIIVRPATLPDPFADDANAEPQPANDSIRSRSSEDSRSRRRRIRDGKRATEGPGRPAPATPHATRARSAFSRHRNPTPPTQRRLSPRAQPDSEPDLRQSQISAESNSDFGLGDIRQHSPGNDRIKARSSSGQPGPSAIKQTSSKERRRAQRSGWRARATTSEIAAFEGSGLPFPPDSPAPVDRQTLRAAGTQAQPQANMQPIVIVPAPAANPANANAPRRVIPMQIYLDTMFRDEMMAELDRRSIAYRPNAAAAALAARLHQADREDNLGLGNAMAFRLIMNQPDAKKRPKGWKMPKKPPGS